MASWAARIRCARVDPDRGSERRNRGVGGVVLTRLTLRGGASLVAQLHQEGTHHFPCSPLVLLRELLPPAPDLPLPERPPHPEEVLPDQINRPFIYRNAKVLRHPPDRQPLGPGATAAPWPHQVLELDHYGPSVPLPPQELTVALVEGLKPAAAQLSTADGDQEPLAVGRQGQILFVREVVLQLLEVVHLGDGH